jgi:uncharacterized protein YbbK (DUF523 family)
MPAISQLADPSIYANQPPAQQAMPLQDLVNLGRTNLAFQREKTLLPSQIEQAQAQAKTSVLQADTTKLDNAYKHMQGIIQQQQTLLTKPDLTANDIIEKAKEQATRFGAPKEALDQALAGIPMNGSASDLRAYLAMNLAKTLGAQSQLEKMYPGGVLPTQLPQSYQPSAPAETSTQAPAAPVGTAPAKAAPVEEFSKPEKLSYQPPVAGQFRAELPSEKVDREFGEKTRTSLSEFQNSYGAIRQNYDKLIDQTEKVAGNTLFGGAAGTAERTLKAKIGTPEYQQLSKDLAKAQIAQIEASGGNLSTDAGKSLAAHANGTVVYDPEVLIGIARRNAAEIENKNMRANGMRIFAEKNGDANIKHFNSMWNKNANDNSVFEMQYIFNRAKTPQQGAEEIQKYIKESGFSEAKRKELATKYLNLQKLATTGSL